jgi:hypothetical protein
VAVSKRYRRRIVVDDREYSWTVAPDREWYYRLELAQEGDFILRVVPPDKSFHLIWEVDAARRHPDVELRLRPFVVTNRYDRIPLDGAGPPPEQMTPAVVASLIRLAVAAVAKQA